MTQRSARFGPWLRTIHDEAACSSHGGAVRACRAIPRRGVASPTAHFAARTITLRRFVPSLAAVAVHKERV